MLRTFIRCVTTDNYMANGFCIANCTAGIRLHACIRRTADHCHANLYGIQHVWRHTKYHRFIKNRTAIRTFYAGLLFRNLFIILLQVNLHSGKMGNGERSMFIRISTETNINVQFARVLASVCVRVCIWIVRFHLPWRKHFVAFYLNRLRWAWVFVL